MLRDITIGQYYPVESLIHSLDPRTKLLGTLIFLISLFISNNIFGIILASLVLALVIYLSKVPFKFMIKGLRTIFVILLISVTFNIFLTPGDVIFKLGPLNATSQGLKTACFMAIRLVYLVIGSSIMTLTTTPNSLTDGLERGLGFLKRLHVPVHEIAMMMAIALRFIPILTEETDRIIKAQTARGADFESGNIFSRAKALIPVLVPLFVSAFRRASDLSYAMESRCYHGGEGRTKFKPLQYKNSDKLAHLFFLIYFVIMIFLSLA